MESGYMISQGLQKYEEPKIRESIVVRQTNMHLWDWLPVSELWFWAPPLPNQFPANVHRKAVEEGTSAWSPSLLRADDPYGDARPWLWSDWYSHLESDLKMKELYLSFSLILPFKQI